MDARQLVDAQFNRAVEIVQSLPKTGPIQTGYEEKLTMYSLYKQATVGNVTSSRPGIFDMLGRAKWDAWAKHRDLDQYEAKSLYVDALLKALSKYSDKTVARDLIGELRSFGGAPDDLVSSLTLTRSGSRGSSSSTSSSEEDAPILSSRLQDIQHSPIRQHFEIAPNDDTFDDEEEADETRDLPTVSQQQRPHSSVSFSTRYKTPLTGSYALPSSPPHKTSLPPIQPLPNFETPSTFADPLTTTSVSAYYAAPSSSTRDVIQPSGASYRFPVASRLSIATTMNPRPPSRAMSVSLEHAMENMQAHLAALSERVDTLELSLVTDPQSQAQVSPSHASSGRGSPADSRSVSHSFEWDIDDMGLWTLVLKPLFRNLSSLQRLLLFFLKSGHGRSPLLIVVRRLCLDMSFLMVVIGALRGAWIKSSMRRKEVAAALVVLWGAVTGRKGTPGRRNI